MNGHLIFNPILLNVIYKLILKNTLYEKIFDVIIAVS